MPTLRKALCLCSAGHSLEHLGAPGHVQSMHTVMLGDRIFDRAEHKDLVVLPHTAKFDLQARKAHRDNNLQTAYELGKAF